MTPTTTLLVMISVALVLDLGAFWMSRYLVVKLESKIDDLERENAMLRRSLFVDQLDSHNEPRVTDRYILGRRDPVA